MTNWIWNVKDGAFGISLRFRIILLGLLTKLREHFPTAGGEPWCSDLQPRCLRNKWRVCRCPEDTEHVRLEHR